MAAIKEYTPYTANGPSGPWTRILDRPADPRHGKLARNVQYEPRSVRTRDGFEAVLDVSGSVFGMYHWVTNSGSVAINRLIYFEGGSTMKMRDLIGGTTQSLFSQSGYSFVAAEAGSRLYIPVFTSAGIGASKMRIVNALLGGVPSDYAFSPPMVTAPVITDTGAGQCTAGDHLFGYILETRTGFTGKPSPQPANVFTPVSFTVSGGSRSLNMAVTATTPDDAAFMHPIMTRRDNPSEYYFVPGASVAVPGGAVWTANMTIDISDEDLANRATLVDEHFDYLTQDVSGSGPFNPFMAIPYGQRMVYLTPQRAYVSDIYDYQVLISPESELDLPGQKQMTSAFVIRGTLYITGPGWTYGFTDSGNGSRAREWGAPSQVSDSLGTTAIRGTCSRTGGDWAWVANKSGLYFFNGQYQPRPMSYGVEPDWNRINWGAPQAISVVDYVDKQTVKVFAPLDSATVPTHIFSFAYDKGFTWEEADFSLDSIAGGNIGCGATVLDPTTGQQQFWVAPAAAGHIWKQTLNLRNDDGAAIDHAYETGLLINPPTGWRYNKVGAVEMDIIGSGTPTVTFVGLNSQFTEELAFDPLSSTPGGYPMNGCDVFDENYSIRIEMNETGGWFDLARVTAYGFRWMVN